MSDLTNPQYYALLFVWFLLVPLVQIIAGNLIYEKWADGAKRKAAVLSAFFCLMPVVHIVGTHYHVDGGEPMHWDVGSEVNCVLVHIACNWLPFALGVFLQKRFAFYDKLLADWPFSNED